jgi:CMP-N-acetylneuraminic acid synthetase
MEHIAIIPARGGSRRVPGKNIKHLGGLPLIAWTINAAHASGCFERVMVSTENLEISNIAKAYGAEVPFLRPPELATDSADSTDVLLDHVIRAKLPSDCALSLLQPTSPFRSPNTIRRAVKEFEVRPERSLVGVTTPSAPLSWHRTITSDGSLLSGPDLLLPGQISCVLSGLIYITRIDDLMTNRNVYGKSPCAFMIEDQIESLDIDTPLDWLFASACVDAGLVVSSLPSNDLMKIKSKLAY